MIGKASCYICERRFDVWNLSHIYLLQVDALGEIVRGRDDNSLLWDSHNICHQCLGAERMRGVVKDRKAEDLR